MSRENVEAVRGIYEGWARGEFRPALEAYDPHIVLVTRPDLPDGGRYVGVESISDYMREYLAPFEDITWTAEELIEADGSVVAVTRQRGTAKRSGLSVEAQIFIVWTFRGRAVIRMEFFKDRAAALEAVA
jgi:ketosteroid isomerase-like protein